MKKLLLIATILCSVSLSAQDSLHIMFHNLLNFPSTNPERTSHYRTILQYAKPDVYVVNELDSEEGADLILDSSLNCWGVNYYNRAAFVNGYDTDNCLFYNADKLGLVSQLQLGTSLRDISVYRLYYKSPNLTAVSDTIYFWFFSCHLKAGVGDYQQRNEEAQQVKFYLNSIVSAVENVFVGGDFNFYSGYESGCQTLLNSGSVPLIDPVSAIGNWSGNYVYADWHTQSTRQNSLGGGTGGGLDDRFDLIFVSQDVLNNENGSTYIANSYRALGQDGNHFNESVNYGTNNTAPDSVINALYNASDHLPISMQVSLDETAALGTQKTDYFQLYFDASERMLKIHSSFELVNLELYDLLGRVVFRADNVVNEVQVPAGLSGIYIWSVVSNGNQASDRVLIF